MIDDSLKMKDECCFLCRSFEERTCFCRRRPPVPVVVERDGQMLVMSKFPVIKFPKSDWCDEFERN